MFHVAALSGRFESSAWGWALARLDVGVSVFFLLSGFLLYRPFVAAHLGEREQPRIGSYARNRALRILPAWWLALAVLWPLLHRVRVPNANEGVMWTLMLVGFQPRLFIGNGLFQAWTLSIELCFYALVPIAGWIVARLGRTWAQRLRAQVVVVAVLGVFGFAARTYVNVRQPGHPALIWLPTQLDLFALGMAGAVVSVASTTDHAGRVVAGVMAAARRPTWCLAGAALAFWVLSTQLALPRRPGLDPLTMREDLMRHVAFAVVSTLLLLPGLVGEIRGRWVGFLASPVMSWLGRVSFGIYLWHVDVVRVLTEPGSSTSTLPFPALVGLTAAASIAAGSISYVLVERPALRLRRPW